MPLSMTGFGRAKEGKVAVEVRTVNHRNRDISIKLPHGHYEHEARIRGVLTEIVSRGRIDLMVNIKEWQGRKSVKANPEVAQAYLKELRALAKKLKVPGEVTLQQVSGWPGVMQMGDGQEEILEWTELLPVVKKALTELQGMRSREGKHLVKDVEKRLDVLAKVLPRVEERSRSGLIEYRNRLKARIAELAGDAAKTDTPRFEMEVAMLAERSDIVEEVVRLRSHIDHMRQLLKEEKPIGRRLDFLVQEMLRETNTIGSKSNDVKIAHEIVGMKEAIEQIREQIQNLE